MRDLRTVELRIPVNNSQSTAKRSNMIRSSPPWPVAPTTWF